MDDKGSKINSDTFDYDTTLKTFGKRLKQVREELQLSQSDVGKGIGHTQTLIAYWERGEREIKMTDAIRLARFLGVSPAYLMDLDDVKLLSDGTAISFTKKDFEIFLTLKKDKRFMSMISDNPKEKIEKMINLWESLHSLLGKTNDLK